MEIFLLSHGDICIEKKFNCRNFIKFEMYIFNDQGSISSTCLYAAFTPADPKSSKSCLTWLSFLGSAHVKAVGKMLVKLSPGVLRILGFSKHLKANISASKTLLYKPIERLQRITATPNQVCSWKTSLNVLYNCEKQIDASFKQSEVNFINHMAQGKCLSTQHLAKRCYSVSPT